MNSGVGVDWAVNRRRRPEIRDQETGNVRQIGPLNRKRDICIRAQGVCLSTKLSDSIFSCTFACPWNSLLSPLGCNWYPWNKAQSGKLHHIREGWYEMGKTSGQIVETSAVTTVIRV